MDKINELVRQALSEVIRREMELPQGTVVCVEGVNTTKDLNHSKVSVSVFPEWASEQVIDILNKNSYILHKELNKKLVIRRIPTLKFIPFISLQNSPF